MSKKDKLPTDAYKGVRDFYPEDQAALRYFITTVGKVAEKYGYEEYHASILEPAELYRGKTSEEIVNEQVYSFTDRGGREVMLRPEMTPTVARMVAARRRDMGFPLRLYSVPNVFRYERPQRGRLREHWQFNIDLFGSRAIEADAEIMTIAYAVMRAFGAHEKDFSILVGSRTFLDEITKRFGLSEDKTRAFRSLVDHRDKMATEEFTKGLQALNIPEEALSPEIPPSDVQAVLTLLHTQGIGNAIFSPYIVRGFDYYTGVVFEIFDTREEFNRSLFGGGRYDNLLSLFDDENVPAVGFGMGDVTLQEFIKSHNLLPGYSPATRVYLAVTSHECIPRAVTIANDLRTKGVNVAIDYGEKKLADQIKAASKHKIPYLVVVGEQELKTKLYTVRDLRSGNEEQVEEELIATILK